MSLIGDGIGHVAFAGVGAGLVAGIWPIWTALAFAVGGALGIEWLRSRRKASGDLALALFFYSGIALGVVLVSLGGGLNASLLTYLFGQPLTVNDSELVVILTLGFVIVLSMLALRRVLFAVVTDEDWSRVSGLPVGFVNNVLAVLTAVAVVAAMRIVGILLIAAMMVLPVASGQILARSFRSTLRWSIAVSVSSVIAGLAVSRIWGTAPGGTIVLIAAAVFAVVSVARRSVVSRLPATEEADL
jgi:zinc transport system permease protein